MFPIKMARAERCGERQSGRLRIVSDSRPICFVFGDACSTAKTKEQAGLMSRNWWNGRRTGSYQSQYIGCFNSKCRSTVRALRVLFDRNEGGLDWARKGGNRNSFGQNSLNLSCSRKRGGRSELLNENSFRPIGFALRKVPWDRRRSPLVKALDGAVDPRLSRATRC